MRIEFFNKETGEVLANTDDYYFIMNDVVWRDNENTYESQAQDVSFDDFVEQRNDVGFRITG